MLSFLPAKILGSLAIFLVVANTVFWIIPLFIVTFFKLALPISTWRKFCSLVLISIAEAWIDVNNFIFWLTQKIEWDIQGLDQLDPKKSYLVISNHNAWVDIPVLQRIFNRKIPFLRFFIKQQLIWVPLLGAAWWALDFPFMKRYSREFLNKHPELRGKDLEATRKACEKFKNYPVSVINFVEGTRFRPDKHKKQNSPYQNLLKPKAGGVTMVFSSMGEYLSGGILDVTVTYPYNKLPTFWEMATGKIPVIVVHVKQLPVPDKLIQENTENQDNQSNTHREWVNQLWLEKDKYITQIKENYSIKAKQE